MSNKPVTELWREAAEKWADLEAAANLLEECKSAVLSQLMLAQGKVAVNKAELLVKGSQEWADHIKRIAEARSAANKAKVRMQYYHMLYWDGQSRAATERLESRL